MGQLSKLDYIHRRAAELLAMGMRPKDVAEEVGVAKSTVYGWKQQDIFTEYLDSLSDQYQEETKRQIRQSCHMAAAYLQRAVDGERKIDGSGVKAAMDILDRAGLTSAKKEEEEDTLDVTDGDALIEIVATLPTHLLIDVMARKGVKVPDQLIDIADPHSDEGD